MYICFAILFITFGMHHNYTGSRKDLNAINEEEQRTLSLIGDEKVELSDVFLYNVFMMIVS